MEEEKIEQAIGSVHAGQTAQMIAGAFQSYIYVSKPIAQIFRHSRL